MVSVIHRCGNLFLRRRAPWLGVRRWMLAASTVAGCVFATASPHAQEAQGAQEAPLDRLIRAYPDALASHDRTTLFWKDGTAMPISDGRADKSFEEKLRHASI